MHYSYSPSVCMYGWVVVHTCMGVCVFVRYVVAISCKLFSLITLYCDICFCTNISLFVIGVMVPNRSEQYCALIPI
jgi:hypothetical protein